MKGFFRKKEKYFLVLDIGTEAVKVLVCEEKNGKAIILAGELEYFDQFGAFDTTGFEKAVIKKAISKAIKNALKQAKVNSQLLSIDGKGKKSLAIISLPPDIFKARILSLSFSRKKTQKIDKKEEKEVLKRILAEGRKEISQDFGKELRIFPRDFKFLDFNILEIKINGFEVPKLLGFSGKDLDFKVLFTFLAKYHLENYQKIFQELELEVLKIFHLGQCLDPLLVEQKEGIFLDIGGRLTQGFLAKQGKLEKIFDFPIGARNFSERLSENLGVIGERARVLKERYEIGELSEPVRKRISQIFSKDISLWFSHLKNNLPSGFKNSFLLGGGAKLLEIEEILKDNNFSPKIISAKDLVNIKNSLLIFLPFLNSPQYISCLTMLMKKIKIFDIRPPKKIESPRAKEFPPLIPFKALSLFRKRIFRFLIIFLIFTLLVVFFLPGKAEIEVWPKSEVLNFKSELKVSNSIKKIDSGAIPGQIIETKDSFSQKFSSSGKTIKEGKARGTIRVYNAYSSYPQTLVATTRFVSAEGKLFRTPKRVVIPGKHYEGGKLVPGSIDIEVIADQAGPEYNIGPSTFSIPGFAGTPRYTAFYAKSFEPMEGGFKEEVSQVTKEDLEAASKILEKKVIEKAKNSLNKKIPADFILIKEAIVSEILQLSTLAEAGQQINSFLGEATALAKALVFKKSDLQFWALNFIRSEIPEKKEVKEDSLNLKYSAKNINFKKGEITLLLEISAQIYSKVDQDFLKEVIRGKRKRELGQEILENFPEITKVEIRVSPFWRVRVPKDKAVLEIKLKI